MDFFVNANAGTGSKFYEAWVIANGALPKLRQVMSVRVFRNKFFSVEIGMTTQTFNKTKLKRVKGIRSSSVCCGGHCDFCNGAAHVIDPQLFAVIEVEGEGEGEVEIEREIEALSPHLTQELQQGAESKNVAGTENKNRVSRIAAPGQVHPPRYRWRALQSSVRKGMAGRLNGLLA